MIDVTTMIDGSVVRSAGAGDLTLLFVHGYCCSATDWLGQFAALSSRYRCAALDLPGHGESIAEPIPTLEALGAAVNRVKDTLPGRIVLIGHSMGCKTIREAYRQSTARVAGMVFIDGSLFVGPKDAIAAGARATLERAGTEAFLADLVEGMFSSATGEAEADAVRVRARAMDADFAGALFLNSVEWDLDHAVQTIRDIEVPALVFQCTAFEARFGWRPMRADEVTPFMALVQLLAPRPTVRVLSTSGHFPMLDAPAPLNEALDAFAASLG